MKIRPIVFVGAGVASVSAIESLRKRGHDGPITLMAGERHLPYDRPPLSKDVLLGTAPRGVPLRPESFYSDLDVDLRLGAIVRSLDPEDRSVRTSDGEVVYGSSVVIATGGAARTLAVPGADLDGVCVLRTLDDAIDLETRLVGGTRVVVVGGGFIGTEVAAAATSRGAYVTVLEAQSTPLQSVLPGLASRVVEHHRARGVSVRGGVEVEAFTGRTRVEGVRLVDGEVVPSDVVIVGVGMRPSDELAVGAGLSVGDGVHVDAQGLTSHPGVYAIGDVANVAHDGGRRRVEHWQSAVRSGQRVAAALVGYDAGPEQPPWFWSDQYDLNIQIAGWPSDEDLRTCRGDPDSEKATVLFHRDGRLTGVAGLNAGSDIRAASDLIAAGVPVDPEQLASPANDLRKLARSLLRAPAGSIR